VDGRDKPGHDGGVNDEGQPFPANSLVEATFATGLPTLHRKNCISGDALNPSCRNG
jgi:hypothetical protein